VRAAITLAYILTPLVFVTWLAFFRQEIPSFPPEGYSLRWFGPSPATIASSPVSAQPAACVIATSIGLCLGLPAALCISRFRFRAARR
jgi:putative spermidine/putrescine transport system permease protein